jgi:hypothetical protein
VHRAPRHADALRRAQDDASTFELDGELALDDEKVFVFALVLVPFVFDRETFAALVSYVDRGGYPRWRNEQRPPYVLAMMNALRAISSPLCIFNAGSERDY